jgi:hypothetical protein
MATIVNNPGTTTDTSNNAGTLFAVLLLLALVFALVYYGLPQARNVFTPSVSIPDTVDVNVNTPNQ